MKLQSSFGSLLIRTCYDRVITLFSLKYFLNDGRLLSPKSFGTPFLFYDFFGTLGRGIVRRVCTFVLLEIGFRVGYGTPQGQVRIIRKQFWCTFTLACVTAVAATWRRCLADHVVRGKCCRVDTTRDVAGRPMPGMYKNTRTGRAACLCIGSQPAFLLGQVFRDSFFTFCSPLL